jgi:hypothetical protein
VLLIDFNADSAGLLSHSMKRRLLDPEFDYAGDAIQAITMLATNTYTAVVINRTYEQDAVALVKTTRKIDPEVLIIACSNIESCDSMLAAGATCFLERDEWLLAGTVLATALAQRNAGG